jgi:hypothetical protein
MSNQTGKEMKKNEPKDATRERPYLAAKLLQKMYKVTRGVKRVCGGREREVCGGDGEGLGGGRRRVGFES